VDDLDHAALAAGIAPAAWSDVEELRLLGGGVGARRGHAGKDAIGFGHAAPDEAGVMQAVAAAAPGRQYPAVTMGRENRIYQAAAKCWPNEPIRTGSVWCSRDDIVATEAKQGCRGCSLSIPLTASWIANKTLLHQCLSKIMLSLGNRL
jgi:hypothetical protein